MDLKSLRRNFATRQLVRHAGPQTAVRRSVAAALTAGALGLAGSAAGQQAYFSWEGNFVSAGDQLDFGLDVNWNALTTSDDVGFQTFANGGGTNRAGDLISSGGIDSIVELLNPFTAGDSYGINDDYDQANHLFDSLLTWPGSTPDDGGTPNVPLDPFDLPPGGGDFLRLTTFNNTGVGAFALDLFGPASDFEIQGAFNASTSTGTATFTSLKFGTTGAGATPAVATFNNDITLLGDLVVAQTGNAQLNYTTPGIAFPRTLNVQGTTTINAGGDVLFTRGTLDADGPVNINGGALSLLVDATLDLAPNQDITVSNGGSFGHEPNFQFQNGSELVIASGSTAGFGGFFALGNGSAATVRVTGTGSNLDATSAFNVFWGVNGGQVLFEVVDNATATINQAGGIDLAQSASAVTQGTINVNTGGDLSISTRLDIADGSAGSAVVTVDGSGSTMTLTGAATLTVGATGAATGTGVVNITDLGVFTTGTGLTTINPTGTVNVNTGGVFNINGNLTVDGGTIISDTTGFNLAAGRTLTAQNNASVTLDGESIFIVEGGQSFAVQTGADLSFGGALSIDGAVTVDGPGSLLVVNTNTIAFVSDVGAFGSSGILTLSNDANGDINRDLHIASTGGTSPSTSGTLNVESGADLTLDELRLTHFDTNTGTAVVNLTGAGSTITQTGASTLVVGNNVAGTATLNVTNSGVFTTGTGTTTINPTGTLNINTNGVFNANGDVNVTGGAINRDAAGGFSLASGKTLTATSDAQVQFTGLYELNGHSLQFESGADLGVTGELVVGDTSTGLLVVDGVGSSLTVGTATRVGLGGAAGTITVRNGAAADFQSLGLATSSNISSSGALNVLSGADVTATSISLGTIGADAAINVDGAGTTLTQSGTSTLILGHATGNTATLNVTGLAVFTTGTGAVTINPTGVLNINTGGQFNASAQINVDGGSITTADTAFAFNLAIGGTLNATNDAQINFNGPRYTLGTGRTFNIESGSDFTTASGLDIAQGNTGTLVVDGLGSSLDVNGGTVFAGFGGGTANITVRNQATADFDSTIFLATLNDNSTGTIDVESGATVSTMDLRLGADTFGPAANVNAALNVTGDGTTLTQGGASNMIVGGTGVGAAASLSVTDQAVFTTGTGTTTIAATGTFNLDTAGEFIAKGNVVIDGGAFNLLDDARDFIPDPATSFTASNGAQVRFAEDYRHDNGGAFTIQSGSSFIIDDYFDLDGGALTIDGVGTTFKLNEVSNTNSDWGRGGQIAVVTISNGAQVTFGGVGRLELSQTDVAGSQVNFFVQSGGDLFANEIAVATGTAGTAFVTVSGAGSTVTQAGASDLTVGTALPGATGSASINVTDSAVFNTGSGAITINPTGSVSVGNSGAFNANNDVTINGGSLTRTNFSGQFNLMPGKNLTASNDAQVHLTGSYSVPNGSTLTIQSGADFTTTSFLNVASTGTGTFIVDGAGSSLTSGAVLSRLGSAGGSATVSFTNGATGSFNQVDFGTGAGSVADIDITSGSSVTAFSFGLGLGGANATLTVTGAGSSFTKTSNFSVGIGGTSGSANLTVSNGAAVNIQAGNLFINQTGTINVGGGTFTATAAPVTLNSGSLDLAAGTTTLGTLDLNGSATVALNGTATLVANTIDYTDIASAFNFFGGTLSVNSFVGILDQNGGTLAPGQSPGTTSLAGYNLNSGSLAIELGGAAPGTQHDQVNVGGVASLGGTIELSLINSFTPGAYESFTVLTSATRFGTFDQVAGVSLGGGRGLAVTYPGNNVLVTEARLGDADLDGDVDDADLAVSFSSYSGPGGVGRGWAQGDFDGDGDVDDADLAVSFSNYTGPLAPGSAVPEPASLAVLALGGLAAVRRRR